MSSPKRARCPTGSRRVGEHCVKSGSERASEGDKDSMIMFTWRNMHLAKYFDTKEFKDFFQSKWLEASDDYVTTELSELGKEAKLLRTEMGKDYGTIVQIFSVTENGKPFRPSTEMCHKIVKEINKYFKGQGQFQYFPKGLTKEEKMSIDGDRSEFEPFWCEVYRA